MRPSHMLLLALTTLALGACLTEESPAEPDIETAIFASSLGVDLSASTRLPSGMYIRDLTVGAGATVASGQDLSVRYAGWLANGTKFDETAAGAPPFTFTLGASEVIQGWDLGVAGMRVGGIRQLIIPPSLGYGPFTYGPIPGNSILVFRVEVVAAQ